MAKTKKKTKRASASDSIQDHAPLRHQQTHNVDPVQDVVVTIRKEEHRVNGKAVYVDHEMVQTVRRQADARIWDRFDDQQTEAAMELYGAWRSITVGVGMRTFDPDRVPGRGDAAGAVEFNVQIRETWRKWVAHCKDRDIDQRVATDMLCHGLSSRLLDNGHRHGWALEEVCRALDVWCFLRHWKQEPRAA